MTPARALAPWALVTVVLAALPFVANDYIVYVGALVLVYSVAGAGLIVLQGWGGQVALAHAGFFGVGAYVTAILNRAGLPWLASMLVALLACTLFGIGAGLPAVRMRGFYLAIATLAFGELTVEVLLEARQVTGGAAGLAVPPFDLVGLPPVVGVYYGASLAALATFGLFAWLGRGRLGRSLKAVRDIESATRSLALPPARLKLVAFAISASLGGLGGALYGQLLGFVTPSVFGVGLMVQFLVIVFLGGVGFLRGAVIGSIVLVVTRQALQDLGPWQTAAFGALLILIVGFLPDGVVSLGDRVVPLVRRRWRREGDAHGAQFEPEPVLPRVTEWSRTSTEPVLAITDLHVAFGGNSVLRGVEFDVRPGFTGLVGPNGAGKTTLFNVIAGYVRPQAGQVLLDGRSITLGSAVDVARCGVARTFQTPRLVPDLTVLENVQLGLDGRGVREAEARARSVDALGRFGLRYAAARKAGSMPLAVLKVVELVRAVVSSPRLLLLDEPAAGLSAEEVEHLVPPLLSLTDEGDRAVIIVEHDLELIARLCPTAMVLDFGRIIATGPAADVMRRPEVVTAYLGVDFAAVGA